MTQATTKIWDISPPVSRRTPMFPGDTPFELTWAATLGPECPVNVGRVTMSPHVGAHADAPLHYSADGASAGEVDLLPYLGPCRVIHAIACGPLIQPHHLAHAAQDLPERVLVRMYATMPQDRFDDALPAFDPATIAWLADQGVKLVGTDSASVDPATSKALASHQVLRQRDMRVLENLCLDEVAEGDYELIALPLRWLGADASPVRAVLRRRWN